MTDTEKEYQERHRFWADKTLTQFGFSNNFFLIAAIGILAFVLKEIETDKQIELSLQNINWKITLARTSALLAFTSICFGTTTMLSRLFDLRLTRHINTIRIKAFNKKNGNKTLDDDYISIKGFSLVFTFLETLIYKHYYIKDSEIKNDKIIKCKFKELRKRALILGRFSWKCFYYQISILIFSVLTFMIAWLK